MTLHLPGEAHALLAAFTWALALTLFKRSGETIPPLALNLFKNVIALALMAATLLFVDADVPAVASSWSDVAVLLISGILGIALADTAFFHSLNRVGLGLVTIVECLYSPLVILCAFLMLRERVTVLHGVGGAFIISAIIISTRHDLPPGRTRRDIVIGFLAGAASMALMAFGIVLAKPVLEHYSLIHAAMWRLTAGTAVILLLALFSRERAACWSVFRPSNTWRFSIPAAILGTYFAMLFWVAGFKYANAATAGILNQSSMIFAIVLATVVLREPFTRRKLVAVVLALIGVLIVWYASHQPAL